MAKMKKKNNYGLWIALIVVAIFGVGGIVAAFSGSATTVIENAGGVTINNPSELGGEFGAVGTTTESSFSGVTGFRLYVNDAGESAVSRYDMGSLTASGLESAWEICDWAATSTLCSIQNTTGSKIIITDRYMAYEGTQPSGSFNLVAGTSSSEVLAKDNGDYTNSGAGIGSLFNLIQKPNGTVATTTFSNWLDNKGSGASYGVVVNPGEFIIAYATSSAVEGTGSVTSTSRLMQGKFYFKWNKLD